MRDNEPFSVTLEEDKIIRIVYGFQRRITHALVKAATSQAAQMVSGKHPAIVAGPHMIYLDYDAGKYIASEEPTNTFTAVAVITKTRLEQTLGRMFLRIHKTSYPVRFFTSESDAEKWLRIYQPEESHAFSKA